MVEPRGRSALPAAREIQLDQPRGHLHRGALRLAPCALQALAEVGGLGLALHKPLCRHVVSRCQLSTTSICVSARATGGRLHTTPCPALESCL
jgi:hypothetical protein